MPFIEYFIIYAISKGQFRIVQDKETKNIQLYKTYNEALNVKSQLMSKHPDVHYHIRTINMEEQFISELTN